MQAFKTATTVNSWFVLLYVYAFTHALTSNSYVTNSEEGLLCIQFLQNLFFFNIITKPVSIANVLTGNSFFLSLSRVRWRGQTGLICYFKIVTYFHELCYFFLQTMSQSNFLLSLQNFAKDTINDEMVELLAPYLEMEDYNMETAKRVSNSC